MSLPTATVVGSLHRIHRPPTIISRDPNETADTMHMRVDKIKVIVAVGERVVTRDR